MGGLDYEFIFQLAVTAFTLIAGYFTLKGKVDMSLSINRQLEARVDNIEGNVNSVNKQIELAIEKLKIETKDKFTGVIADIERSVVREKEQMVVDMERIIQDVKELEATMAKTHVKNVDGVRKELHKITDTLFERVDAIRIDITNIRDMINIGKISENELKNKIRVIEEYEIMFIKNKLNSLSSELNTNTNNYYELYKTISKIKRKR